MGREANCGGNGFSVGLQLMLSGRATSVSPVPLVLCTTPRLHIGLGTLGGLCSKSELHSPGQGWQAVL